MTVRQNVTEADLVREEYSAPVCKCFSFETSGLQLIHISGEDGYIGDSGDNETGTEEGGGDWETE